MSAAVAAIAAANTAIAIQAQQQADEAHDAACAVLLGTFQSKGSTLDQRQTYAECVARETPQSPADLHTEKVIVCSVLVVVIAGAIIGALVAEYDRAFWAFNGAVIGLLGCGVVAGIFSLICFLAS